MAFDFILDKENGVCQEYIDRLTKETFDTIGNNPQVDIENIVGQALPEYSPKNRDYFDWREGRAHLPHYGVADASNEDIYEAFCDFPERWCVELPAEFNSLNQPSAKLDEQERDAFFNEMFSFLYSTANVVGNPIVLDAG